MKKKYMKPSMTVYAIQLPHIICTSDWDGELTHIPGMPNDGNHLA